VSRTRCVRERASKIEARSFHIVIASAAKQSRNLSAEGFWIASLRSQWRGASIEIPQRNGRVVSMEDG